MATANNIRQLYGYGDVKKSVDGLALDITKQSCSMANETVNPVPVRAKREATQLDGHLRRKA